ncbi:hypothetical protein PoB_000783500 [Plakobranchus ocellatus]|uniref:Uncharacterized protein n=1 Tax=Plakobranchus ocellatus TaxID=259542 RepID=A0AAV3YF04_9GAST|nr:hypothetical protein PoB_000783500 [Plakobranchus ocellatus]
MIVSEGHQGRRGIEKIKKENCDICTAATSQPVTQIRASAVTHNGCSDAFGVDTVSTHPEASFQFFTSDKQQRRGSYKFSMGTSIKLFKL